MAALLLIARGTLIFALGLTLLAFSRRATAATRHLIALATLGSTSLAVCLVGSLPEIELLVLPLSQPSVPLLATIWMAGAAIFLARLGAGMIRFSLIAHGAAAIEPGIVVSERVSVPMTAGALAPVIVLPRSSESWSPERMRLVLLHERALVQRFDSLSALICEAAAALWWFHPLAWLLLRRARLDAEQAADDRVLCGGEKASVYATHLLEIAGELQSDVALALPMARHAGFEARLRSLLEARDRGSVSAKERALCIALIAAALALSALRPAAATPINPNLCTQGHFPWPPRH